VEEAVAAMKDGAYDFLQKRWTWTFEIGWSTRGAATGAAAENLLLREEYATAVWVPAHRGRRCVYREVSQQIQKGPRQIRPVCCSERAGRERIVCTGDPPSFAAAREPFVALNCAAIPEGLVENELFGHERGRSRGRSAQVGKNGYGPHGGRCFWMKLENCRWRFRRNAACGWKSENFERVGGKQSIEVDVRIVVATNRDLQN